MKQVDEACCFALSLDLAREKKPSGQAEEHHEEEIADEMTRTSHLLAVRKAMLSSHRMTS
jgi:hypothetical protein